MLNFKLRRWSLWEKEDLIGRPLVFLIPRNLRDAHNMGFSRFYVTGGGKLLDQKIITGEGKELLAEHTVFAEQIDGKWVLGPE